MVDAQFEFSKIVVVESLPEGERKTGRELRDTIRLELAARGEALQVEYVVVPGRDGFISELERLRQESDHGHIPIIHVECHGDRASGLHFSDGTLMPWEDLADRLLQINLRTGFNLLVLVSACFGAYFLGMLSAVRASPCWGVVAPTDTVYPSELESGFSDFYRALFSTWDLGAATQVLEGRTLRHGYWLSELAERWFSRIVLNYLQTHCTVIATEQRIRDLRVRQQELGLPWVSLHDMRRELRLANSRALDKYFWVFFQVDTLPEATVRFAALRHAIQEQIHTLAADGTYLI
jgi:hypothetical protein